MASRLRLGKHLSDKKTRGHLKHIENAFSMYWTFMQNPDISLTNNDAERALRHAVIWRKTSYGVQSSYGALFVETSLSVIHSLQAQQQKSLLFFQQALDRYLLGLRPPSLLPQLR